VRDLAYGLSQQYFKILSGITLGAVSVPIFNTIVPAGVTGPYIIYSGITVNQGADTSNTNYQFSVTVLLDIVMMYLGDAGGSSDVDMLSGKVKQLICPGRPMDSKPVNLLPFFKCVITKHLSDTSFDAINGTTHVVRRLVRFQHIIEELA